MKEKNIYLLEDDPDIQDIIKYILTRDGYKVYAFERVRDFNEQLEKAIPDLFILDITLPDGNGLEVSKAIKEQKAVAAPVILMSADITNEQKAAASGASNFISKPFRMDEFRSAVGKLLAA